MTTGDDHRELLELGQRCLQTGRCKGARVRLHRNDIIGSGKRKLPGDMSGNLAKAKDLYEAPAKQSTSAARGFRNAWVNMTLRLSWDERESAESKAYGKKWKINTSLKCLLSRRCALRCALQRQGICTRIRQSSRRDWSLTLPKIFKRFAFCAIYCDLCRQRQR